MKKIFIAGALALLASGCTPTFTQPSASPANTYDYSHKLQVGVQTLSVELAATPAKMSQGLSDRESMTDGQGMLFDFGSSSSVYPAFWMKDMDFNLDFIWISQNKIIGITANVPAPGKINDKADDSNLTNYYPPSPVDEVLEVNDGWAKKNHIAVGDAVSLLTAGN